MHAIDMMFSMFEDSFNSMILNLLSFIMFALVITLFNQKIQTWIWLREAESALQRLNILLSQAKKITIEKIKELGNSDPSQVIDDFLDFFTIEPVSLDPRGIIEKLDYILNVRDKRVESFIKRVVPNIEPVFLSNMEGLLETNLVLNYLYREMRHLLILGKKTKNMIIIMQLQMNLPLIMRYAESYFNAVDAFSNGKPIGDGAGSLVASKLIHGSPYYEVAQKIVAAEFDYKNRHVIAIKAVGPGAEIGKPGNAISRLITEKGGKVARIIMVDAALKLEGELTGRVAEGVGAAIGGIGVEKYKIEEVASKYNIPLDAIVIKMSLEEAINTMKKEIITAAEKAKEKVLNIIEERVNEGETVIVAGIGNTIGIGQ